jgi:hypothetical protein
MVLAATAASSRARLAFSCLPGQGLLRCRPDMQWVQSKTRLSGLWETGILQSKKGRERHRHDLIRNALLSVVLVFGISQVDVGRNNETAASPCVHPNVTILI